MVARHLADDVSMSILLGLGGEGGVIVLSMCS